METFSSLSLPSVCQNQSNFLGYLLDKEKSKYGGQKGSNLVNLFQNGYQPIVDMYHANKKQLIYMIECEI